jgi:hypothetical protein
MAKVLFIHGSGIHPSVSRKRARLEEAGHQVEVCPDILYPRPLTAWAIRKRSWFDAAVQIAQEAYDRCQPDVVVGSSMGGAVAMNLRAGSAPQVLVAPAWRAWMRRFGTAARVQPATVIVHGRRDWLVFARYSRRLLLRSKPQVPHEAAVVAYLEERLFERFGDAGSGVQVKGRLLQVVRDDHKCRSLPAVQALLGAVEVLVELAGESSRQIELETSTPSGK